MPLLGRAKKRSGALLRSSAAASAGSQNILYACLSAAVLIGLAVNAVFGLPWANSVVALMVAAACLQVGLRAWRGDYCAPGIC